MDFIRLQRNSKDFREVSKRVQKLPRGFVGLQEDSKGF